MNSNYNNYKVSVLLTEKNKKYLDKICKNTNSKYSPMINRILSTFADMPEAFKRDFKIELANMQLRYECALERTVAPYYSKELEMKIECIKNIFCLLSQGSRTVIDGEDGTAKTKLKNGYIIYPSIYNHNNPILVNPDDAADSTFAHVIECLNSQKYGDIPHFIYLDNESGELSYESENRFRQLCKEKWPKFEEIERLDRKFSLKANPNNPREYLNEKEHLEAPVIGVFRVPVRGESPYSNDPPLGIEIIRNKVSEE
jgi:hypothetical protein